MDYAFKRLFLFLSLFIHLMGKRVLEIGHLLFLVLTDEEKAESI